MGIWKKWTLSLLNKNILVNRQDDGYALVRDTEQDQGDGHFALPSNKLYTKASPRVVPEPELHGPNWHERRMRGMWQIKLPFRWLHTIAFFDLSRRPEMLRRLSIPFITRSQRARISLLSHTSHKSTCAQAVNRSRQ